MRTALKLCLAVLAAIALWAGSANAALPPIRHVFVIVLENEGASTTFAANSPAPYLADTLRAQGAFVPSYYGIGHQSADNYIAMISGQAPNAATQSDCQQYSDVVPGTMDASGQATGEGCVYPSSVPTIGSQLQAAGLTWRDYNESMGADPKREPAECAHPAPNGRDGTQSASATDEYATRHNPFVYFHGIVDDTALCNSHVVNLNLLPNDLATAGATPNYVFITPDLCSDGHDATCADPKRPGGFAGIDQFLSTWVPQITSSPAFQQDGLLIINFDEAGTSDTSSCCGEIAGPGSPSPGATGPGGGDTGAVLLSPFIAPGTVSGVAYNHYTMLRSVEDLFGLSHIAYAGLAGQTSFGPDIFTRPAGAPPGTPPVAGGGGAGGGIACFVPKLPHASHGRLGANTLVAGIRLVRGSRGHRAILLRAVQSARLTVVIKPKRGPTRRARLRVTPCHSYSVTLPSGHGHVELTASVGGGVQKVRRAY